MLTAITLALALSSSVSAASIQKPGLQVPPQYRDQANVVRQMFNTSYQTYRKYAFGHDDLSPLSLSYNDPRNGWGASIADAMSTMYIMGGFDAEFKEAINHFSTIDFNRSYTTDTVSIFETTIRYIGGFLSAYELSGYKYPILVQKAKQIGDKLVHGFDDGAIGFPYGFIDFSTNQPTIAESNIAEAGTLVLEWGTLSTYTSNSTYRRLAEGSSKHIANLPAPYPGLAAQGIVPATGQFDGTYVTWGGGSDSYFEYLIKYARLTNTNDNIYVNTWKTAVDSSIKYLLTTSSVGNWTYIADSPQPGELRLVGSHLECFHAGNWIMGGKMLNNQTIVDIALKLADSCWNTYASTATGIGPEAFAFSTGANTLPSGDDLTFYNKHGFYIQSGAQYYDLRPEVLESNFYAWRATGNTKYLDRAKAAINSLNKYVAVNGAYAGIDNVNDLSDTAKFDNTESFWFAEVLKYLYLTFDTPSHISLDEWVFNTEAHPLRAPPAKPNYNPGGGPLPPLGPTPPGKAPAKPPVFSPVPKLPNYLRQPGDTQT